MTDAQIKALGTGTPVTVVVQAGAGIAIFPLATFLTTNFAAGAYTNIDPAAWLTVAVGTQGFGTTYLPNDTSITNGPTTRFTNVFGSTTPKRLPLVPYIDTEGLDDWGALTVPSARSDADNANLTVQVSNAAAGAFTGGHAANTLTITVAYFLLGAAQ